MLDRAIGSTVWNWGPESPLKLSMLLNSLSKLKVRLLFLFLTVTLSLNLPRTRILASLHLLFPLAHSHAVYPHILTLISLILLSHLLPFTLPLTLLPLLHPSFSLTFTLPSLSPTSPSIISLPFSFPLLSSLPSFPDEEEQSICPIAGGCDIRDSERE
jgi:hypothetical protein